MPHSKIAIDVLEPETYSSGDPATSGFPLDQYEYLRNEAPIFKREIEDPMPLDDIWIVSRHEDEMAIDRDAELWPSAREYTNVWHFNPIGPTQGSKPGMVTMDGEDHKRDRKTISLGFTPNPVSRFETEFLTFTGGILDAALAKDSSDFVEDVAFRMPLYAITDLLGVPDEDRETFLGSVRVLAALTDPNYTSDMEDLMNGFTGLTAHGTELAQKCREKPGEDLMSTIVAAHVDEALSDELMGFVILLSAAGSDATRNALAHGLHGLIRNPEQTLWLRAQDTMPDTAIQEIVRWSTPIIDFNRTTTRGTEIHGQEIKEGEGVAMLSLCANYDPEVFTDPTSVDLTRNPKPRLSLGHGPHVCLGRYIAASEIRIRFEELLKRTSDIKQTGDISDARDNFVHGVDQLPVTVTPRPEARFAHAA